ncbi:MAG: preprotein translocase subunit SecA [Candidatus Lightella neohaematopini]|nr:preprotein translocase subunit SecA [Candidatus Lightella neohaematopini]MCV2528740.1 preprotein translocase subunit SecA [Candidatus Lightella neohaematopini]
MIIKFLTKIFSNRNTKIIRNIHKIVDIINNLEQKMLNMTDQQLSDKTNEFRFKLSNGVNIDNLLPEAFAVVREASRRIFGMRHFDVQIIGGIILHYRCIAEMRTGEGKTLTATLPAYLNALTGHGVHIVTVNDYLAQRDAQHNKPLFEFLGLTVGINLQGLSIYQKQHAYNADITYGTNNEYGFDYLRDNMILNKSDKVQRTLYFALLDEVDSILIDEARTPLVISGTSRNNTFLYKRINKLISTLKYQEKEDSYKFHGDGHYTIDKKTKQVHLTERGLVLIEKLLVQSNILDSKESLYCINNIMLMHHVIAALKAHNLFSKNIDYIVKNGKIIIVDEHTGRIIPDRRWSDGLHQAIEAKENLKIQNENQTLASITFQNYFRLYYKLSGMTGTASTEAAEFKSIYKLDTVTIPTNKPMIRNDLPDLVYITENDKIDAIINDIKSCIKRQQPVLVGTISIEKSELISRKLKKLGINHKVLNAKHHAMEADIIAQAGTPGAVTIATNMAGRGTDIKLGGIWQEKLSKSNKFNKMLSKNSWKQRQAIVLAAGGLHIIGTERHESRRIDNQLRGRSGRQGDVGSSRFYLSMEDSLMRIFTSDRITNIIRKLSTHSHNAIEHPWITKAIANAQRKVENYNFDIRRQLLEYDNVINEQRCAIYSRRNELINSDDISKIIKNIRQDVLKYLIFSNLPINALKKKLLDDFSLYIPKTLISANKITLYNILLKQQVLKFNNKESIVGNKVMRKFEKCIMLQVLDDLWKEHLSAMEYLRQGIHLRSYAQKDPKQEYQKESYTMFINMLNLLKYEVISIISNVSIDELNISS